METTQKRSMLHPRTFTFLALIGAWILSLIAYEAVAGEGAWWRSKFDPHAEPRAIAPASAEARAASDLLGDS